jgi:hypothetical protein
MENATILISDIEIEDPRQLIPVIEAAMQAEIPSLLIVAGRLSDSAIALLLTASQDPTKWRVARRGGISPRKNRPVPFLPMQGMTTAK